MKEKQIEEIIDMLNQLPTNYVDCIYGFVKRLFTKHKVNH